MLYHWFEFGRAAFEPARLAVDTFRFVVDNPFNPFSQTHAGRSSIAACELFERSTRRYAKPSFGLNSTTVDGRPVSVVEKIALERPFMRLIHFSRDVSDEERAASPRVLLVAPMSGHFATLLRGTVESLLPGHEVFITDWNDAREVPVAAGAFSLDDYISQLIELFHYFAGNVHVVAVCQPAVPVLAAVSLLEADNDPNVPASMTLMGGPIDTRINPTIVNRHAKEKGFAWFERNVIAEVPFAYRGRGRRVYPGFLQLSGFVSMNLERHAKAHHDLFLNITHSNSSAARKHKEFYDEYLAVMDLAAEFYLETIETVFLRHALAVGTMQYHGERVDPSAIRRVPILTIEGEQDDITGAGQCHAALDLATNLPAEMKLHHQQHGAGHYGIFSGSRYRKEILPHLVSFMAKYDRQRGSVNSPRRTLRPKFSLN